VAGFAPADQAVSAATGAADARRDQQPRS
jgi:hypothetical protein